MRPIHSPVRALQHTTTEMVRWLRSDYGFDPRTVSLLMGVCMEYEVGNVNDPAYTMACKIVISLLAALSC